MRSYRANTKHKRSRTQDSQNNSKSWKFAFRHKFVRPTHRIQREGSSSKIKMRVSLQRRAIRNLKICVSLQRRATKCMKRAQDIRGSCRHTKIIVLPQFRTSDQHEVTKGSPVELKNLDVRRARSDKRVARAHSKIAFRHNFGHPTSTKWRKGYFDNLENLHFTTVLGVRWARSNERVVSRRALPNLPCRKKNKAEQRFWQPAAFLSNFSQLTASQQLFSATILSYQFIVVRGW